jgi:hypothetical protein
MRILRAGGRDAGLDQTPDARLMAAKDAVVQRSVELSEKSMRASYALFLSARGQRIARTVQQENRRTRVDADHLGKLIIEALTAVKESRVRRWSNRPHSGCQAGSNQERQIETPDQWDDARGRRAQ